MTPFGFLSLERRGDNFFPSHLANSPVMADGNFEYSFFLVFEYRA